MKITREYLDLEEEKYIKHLWQSAARQISLEHGIFIEAIYIREYDGLGRIYFKVGDKEFDSLNTLKRALANKAFL